MSQALSNVFKLHDVINVKDPAFGAKGDGVTDDKAAIQTAIDAAEAKRGGIVFFPAGIYLIKGTLTINEDNIFLEGEGGAASEVDTVDTNWATIVSRASTRILWDAATSGSIMIQFIPTNTTGTWRVRRSGGISRMMIDGANVATIGVESLSFRHMNWEDMAVVRCTTINFSHGIVKTGTVTGGNSSSGDNLFKNCVFANKGLVGNTGHTYAAWGDATGNPALGTFLQCTFFGERSDHIQMEQVDGHTWTGCRWNGAVGLVLHGDDTAVTGKGTLNVVPAHNNAFFGCQGKITAKKTVAGTLSSYGNVAFLTLGNTIQLPTIEAGAQLLVITNDTGFDQRNGGLLYGRFPSVVIVGRTLTNQTTTSGATPDVTWDTEITDPFGITSVPVTNIATPAFARWMRATVSIEWDSNSTGGRFAGVKVNSTFVAKNRISANANAAHCFTTRWVPIVGGTDTITVAVSQNSGGNLDVLTSVSNLQVEFA